MAGSDFLFQHAAPALGCIVATALFASPLQAVLAVRRSKSLGALNPLPMVAMWANCVAWLVYACLHADPYVLASNVPGVLLAAFMTLATYGAADEGTRDTMARALLFFVALITAAGTGVSFSGAAHPEQLWGYVCVVILVIFYSAPLSVIAEVVQQRNSAALVPAFAAMNAINGMLWTLYGLAKGDPFIWGPNLVGAVFGSLQVVLCYVFPATKRPPPPDKTPSGVDDQDLESSEHQGILKQEGGGGSLGASHEASGSSGVLTQRSK